MKKKSDMRFQLEGVALSTAYFVGGVWLLHFVGKLIARYSEMMAAITVTILVTAMLAVFMVVGGHQAEKRRKRIE